MHDVYERLAFHLATLGMGYPQRESLLDILRAVFTPAEAEVALLLPTRVAPLDVVGVEEIARYSSLAKEDLAAILESLAERGLLYSGQTAAGTKGYALQQVGYGFPQTFFWGGRDTAQARQLVDLIGKYHNREVTRAYAGSDNTKAYRYVPAGGTLPRDTQAVYTYHMMEEVIRGARAFAVAHCPCRMIMRLRGRGCEHPLEVCLKFDEMAEYVIDRGLARKISREETLDIIRKSEEAGLVHFVDNTTSGVKHNCNCCGCACWNVGTIRRRKIPRDVLMATYFLRQTDEGRCTGCGGCIDICPVDALTLKDGVAVVDEEWCIGCGLCVTHCSTGAAALKFRPDIAGREPLPDFRTLHARILVEKGLTKNE